MSKRAQAAMLIIPRRSGTLTMSGPRIETVVIPVDGSQHARRAVQIGAAIAAKFGARAILLHVLLRNTSLPTIYELARSLNIPDDVLEKFKHATPAVYDFGLTVPLSTLNPVVPTGLLVETGQRVLEAERGVIESEGIKDIATLLEDGDVAQKILDVSHKEKADLIVMGRRGLGALQGLLSGSASTKVSHLAPVTVVSVT
jgi:nucleotide-binding universal stress UspA family protein